MTDPFTERLGRVRDRFAASLDAKIDAAYAAVPSLSAGAPAAATAIEEAYRCVHGMVGVGPTIGFPATGRAAREVETVLRPPRQEARGLTPEELALLIRTLRALREAAASELQSLQGVKS